MNCLAEKGISLPPCASVQQGQRGQPSPLPALPGAPVPELAITGEGRGATERLSDVLVHHGVKGDVSAGEC